MPVSAATLAKLMLAGITGDTLLDIVASIDADQMQQPKQRSAHAIRQERYRNTKSSQNVTSDASQSDASLPSSGSPSPTPPSTPNLPTNPPIAPPREKFASPEVVLQRAIDPLNAKRFCDHCASKGKRLSPQTAEMIADVLLRIRAGGGSSIAAVDYAIKRGWTTIDEDWLRDSGAKAVAVPPKAEDWSARVSAFRMDGTWIHAWGPKPGENGCKAPRELLQGIAA